MDDAVGAALTAFMSNTTMKNGGGSLRTTGFSLSSSLWITILRKRERYRKAYYDFDVNKVAQMTEQDVERLMQDEGIVRNRLKIKSAISNAKLFIAIQKEFGSFYNYTLSFFPEQKPISYQPKTLKDIQASTPESDAMSKDMKKRGFKFFGSTICYAYLQATGFVNDHLVNCICRKQNYPSK